MEAGAPRTAVESTAVLSTPTNVQIKSPPASLKKLQNSYKIIAARTKENEALMHEVSALQMSNDQLKTTKRHLEETVSSLSLRRNAMEDKREIEIGQLCRSHEEEVSELLLRYEAQHVVMQESSEIYSSEINAMGRKLEDALLSDIESREQLEALTKCLHAVTADLASLMKTGTALIVCCGTRTISHCAIRHTGLNISQLESDSFENRKRSLESNTEALRNILQSAQTPHALAPLIGLVLKLFDQHISVLSTELDEEILVSKSLGFAETARKVIKSLTNEAAELADIVYQADSFAVSLISLLEKNGALPPNQTSKIFTYSEGAASSFDYATTLPMRFDQEASRTPLLTFQWPRLF